MKFIYSYSYTRYWQVAYQNVSTCTWSEKNVVLVHPYLLYIPHSRSSCICSTHTYADGSDETKQTAWMWQLIEGYIILSHVITMHNSTRTLSSEIPVGTGIWCAHISALCVCVSVCGVWYPRYDSASSYLLSGWFYLWLAYSITNSERKSIWTNTARKDKNKPIMD